MLYQYELTERGKIVIAVVLVLLLLVLPSAYLFIKTVATHSGEPIETPEPGTSETLPPGANEPPPVISESPPPNGGGFSQTDDTRPNDVNGVNDPDENNPQNGLDEPHLPDLGPSGGNPGEGTLSFFFSPDRQSGLDAETSSMLDEFISSPINTPDSLIAVELPQLSFEDESVVISAVISAFAERGVPENRLSFFSLSSEAVEGVFEIYLSFIHHQSK